MELDKIFTQDGNTLTVNYLNTSTVFEMPDYFDINSVSNDLKMMSLIVMFHPEDESLINHEFTRKSAGNKIGLAFSGGVDSAAAYCLLPKDKTVVFHHKRIIESPTSYKHDNAMAVIDSLDCDVLVIESDLEEMPVHVGKSNRGGFLNDFSFFGGFILLADYLELGYLSTGMMFESTYIEKGHEFRDFHNSEYYQQWFTLFQNANIPFFFPCIPCSEIMTNRIVEANNAMAQSCVRGINGTGCNSCYKCFRKKMINGELIRYFDNGEIMKAITSTPIKQGSSLIYAMNTNKFTIPELSEFVDVDTSFLGTYFEYTLNSIPEEFREYLSNELNKYASANPNVDLLKNFKI